MAKGAYVGVNGTSHKLKNFYVGVNNVAHKVVKGYVGVNGVPRLFWSKSIQINKLLDFWRSIPMLVIKYLDTKNQVNKITQDIAYYALVKVSYDGNTYLKPLLASRSYEGSSFQINGNNQHYIGAAYYKELGNFRHYWYWRLDVSSHSYGDTYDPNCLLSDDSYDLYIGGTQNQNINKQMGIDLIDSIYEVTIPEDIPAGATRYLRTDYSTSTTRCIWAGEAYKNYKSVLRKLMGLWLIYNYDRGTSSYINNYNKVTSLSENILETLYSKISDLGAGTHLMIIKMNAISEVGSNFISIIYSRIIYPSQYGHYVAMDFGSHIVNPDGSNFQLIKEMRDGYDDMGENVVTAEGRIDIQITQNSFVCTTTSVNNWETYGDYDTYGPGIGYDGINFVNVPGTSGYTLYSSNILMDVINSDNGGNRKVLPSGKYINGPLTVVIPKIMDSIHYQVYPNNPRCFQCIENQTTGSNKEVLLHWQPFSNTLAKFWWDDICNEMDNTPRQISQAKKNAVGNLLNDIFEFACAQSNNEIDTIYNKLILSYATYSYDINNDYFTWNIYFYGYDTSSDFLEIINDGVNGVSFGYKVHTFDTGDPSITPNRPGKITKYYTPPHDLSGGDAGSGYNLLSNKYLQSDRCYDLSIVCDYNNNASRSMHYDSGSYGYGSIFVNGEHVEDNYVGGYIQDRIFHSNLGYRGGYNIT